MHNRTSLVDAAVSMYLAYTQAIPQLEQNFLFEKDEGSLIRHFSSGKGFFFPDVLTMNSG